MVQPNVREREVLIDACGVRLRGTLRRPPAAAGLVVFAHGSGSSRFSRRNRHVAGVLEASGLTTLLFDLLTEAEERIDRTDASLRFDIPLLTRRLIGTIDWISRQPALADLPLGLFGASTGAAAALGAAAARAERVTAVVSRGGRPDLAAAGLAEVICPTLLIVGGNDREVLALNHAAAATLTCRRDIVVIPGAGHLFEQPGTLEAMAVQARDWFLQTLPASLRSADRSGPRNCGSPPPGPDGCFPGEGRRRVPGPAGSPG